MQLVKQRQKYIWNCTETRQRTIFFLYIKPPEILNYLTFNKIKFEQHFCTDEGNLRWAFLYVFPRPASSVYELELCAWYGEKASLQSPFCFIEEMLPWKVKEGRLKHHLFPLLYYKNYIYILDAFLIYNYHMSLKIIKILI